MKKSAGFVLMTVLIFMQLFSLISLYSVTTASVIMKSNDHLWQGMKLRQNSQAILQRLSSHVMANNNICFIPLTPASDLAKKTLTWWQLMGCRDNVNGIRYYYVMESLGEDPCAIMQNNSINQPVIAHYYRITLCIIPESKPYCYLLQGTTALPRAATLTCQQKSHTVTKGLQSRREL